MELDIVKLREIKPALAGYIRESKSMLKNSEIPDEKTVHDIRVLMKKSRAVLSLVDPQLGNGYQDRDLTAFREIGRLMCGWRETTVQRKTLKEFKKQHPDIFSSLTENTKLNQMLGKQEMGVSSFQGYKVIIDQIEVLLDKAGYRIRFQTMNLIDPQLLIKELDVTYRLVSDIYIACRNKPNPESLHKFRKKAKDFLYQLYVFKPLNPTTIKAVEKKLDSMTQNLGKYNDIAQIIKMLDYNHKDVSNPAALNELVIKFYDAQDYYLSKVWPSAYQIFCPGQKLVNVLGFKLLII